MNTPAKDNEIDSSIDHRAGLISMRICAVMLVLYALYYARSLVIPVATAIVLYLTLRPIVRHAKRIGVPSPVGAIGIIAGILLTLGLGTYLVLEPAKETIGAAPQHLAVAKQKLSFITDRLKDVDQATEELAETEDVAAGEVASEKPVPVEIKQPTWTSGWSYLSGTGNVVSFLTICIALLYFLLATGDDLLRSVMRSLPNFSSRRKLVEVIENVQEGLGSYLAQVSAINAGLGVCVAVVMWMLGMPSPIMWGVMAFAFNFIPIVGAIAGALIIFFVALLNFEPTYYAFVVTLAFMTLTSLEGQFITPAILGRSMSMSPVLVFLSIVVWGWMWGIMGVFLSVPILIAARMACEGYEDLRPLAMILGAEIPEPEKPKEASENDASASNADSAKKHVQHENIPSSHTPITQSVSQ
ncbi:MAG TPA: AI-2E family transporter [Rhodopirellula baltica]|uniref:Predicted permease n=1 Tax=Rhodopirellula baltica (strain DSM 10527 / NCIMB 13988 / SH1) TaxID=243090 RepID=Q7UYF5_RHOBA|nr:AI-2E family transporter [Rhodopirellula baltica]CAD71687.1 predicted permease [Rhodopirellula baltica SH 1]HBE63290.1 AI-2E family transporter [Rhodopirellula baltica]